MSIVKRKKEAKYSRRSYWTVQQTSRTSSLYLTFYEEYLQEAL